MNFSIIPHFLTVLTDIYWSLGPEYVFEVKKNTSIYRKPFTTIELKCVLHCQPKTDSLVCRMPRISYQTTMTYENSEKDISPLEVIETPHLFEMKFNKRGVQSLLMKPSSYVNAAGIIRQIAEVFNVSIDLSNRAYRKPQFQDDFYLIDEFKDWEETLRGNCSTQYRIMHGKDEIKKRKFHLTVLPLADLNIKSSILIEKIKEPCRFSERYVQLLNEVKVMDYFSGMKIENTFQSFVEVVAGLNPEAWNSQEYRMFSERIDLSLIDVRRAMDKFSNASKEWLIIDNRL